MENSKLLNSLRSALFFSFTMLEKIVEICPGELWNKKVSGFVFWQQLIHTLAGMYGWLREEEPESIPFLEFNGKKIYPEFESEPEILLTKTDVTECFNRTKEAVEKWFAGKDDDWLISPCKINTGITNFDITEGQIRHIMYHVGHLEAIFRENGIKTGEYLE